MITRSIGRPGPRHQRSALGTSRVMCRVPARDDSVPGAPWFESFRVSTRYVAGAHARVDRSSTCASGWMTGDRSRHDSVPDPIGTESSRVLCLTIQRHDSSNDPSTPESPGPMTRDRRRDDSSHHRITRRTCPAMIAYRAGPEPCHDASWCGTSPAMARGISCGGSSHGARSLDTSPVGSPYMCRDDWSQDP
jgi:hypothetical protein